MWWPKVGFHDLAKYMIMQLKTCNGLRIFLTQKLHLPHIYLITIASRFISKKLSWIKIKIVWFVYESQKLIYFTYYIYLKQRNIKYNI